MDVIARIEAYEAWMRAQVPVIEPDLALKHERMAQAAFPFLRATFHHWVETWREVCPETAAGPTVLAVGDLHVENFGTWRDAEGRLVWGVNDFDEAYPMPYAIDLVRLATSALLAAREQTLSIDNKSACAALLAGYTEAIENSGQPFVLEESHPILRDMALSEQRDPVSFWDKMNKLADTPAPAPVRRLLADHLPESGLPFRTVHRVAGLGSLGRQRFVALAAWRGGMVAREAKALFPSAYAWATGERAKEILSLRAARRAVRCPDPFLDVRDGWLLRRLAPHCSRIELASLPKKRDEERLIYAMGCETANVHHGTPEALPAIRVDLKGRKPAWLFNAASRMAEATLKDWEAWRASRKA